MTSTSPTSEPAKPACPPLPKQVITGRAPVPITNKINPIWWFGNTGDPTPPDWYMPGKAQWLRTLGWYARNPLTNFNNYVIGVCDKNYTVVGTAAISPIASDQGQTGYRWSKIQTPVPLPFVSYAGKNVEWYAGWMAGGNFALKFTIRNSPVQVV